MPYAKHQGLKKKRKRTVISPEQLCKLEASFQEIPWPNRSKKEELSQDLGVTEKFICVWFQNRRAKARRDEEESARISNSDIKCKEKCPEKSESQSTCSDSELGCPSDATMEKDRPDSDDLMETTEPKRHVDGETIMKVKIPTKGSKAQRQTAAKLMQKAIHHEVKEKSVVSSRSFTKDLAKESSTSSQISYTSPKPEAIGNKKNEETGQTPESTEPKDLLKLSRNLNNQMNWGTFGLASARSAPGYGKNMKMSINSVMASTAGILTADSTATSKMLGMQAKSRGESDNTSDFLDPISGLFSSDGTEEVEMSELSVPSYDMNVSYPPTLFKAVIDMMAVAEGGIIPVSHPDFSQAVNNVLYGIRINTTSRLTYTKESGLQLVDDLD